MDDDLRATFRDLEVPTAPRAEFVTSLHADLATRLGFPQEQVKSEGAESTSALRLVGASPRFTSRRGGSRGTLLVAAAVTALLTVAVVGAIGVVGQRQTRQSLLAIAQANGAVSVAVRFDAPQVTTPAGTLAGFDIDVANALGRRLGLTPQLDVISLERMLAPDAMWQLAMPSRSVADTGGAVHQASVPYYAWPAYLLVAADAPLDMTTAGLSGRTVCVVTGSAGESWARSAVAGSTSPPLIVIDAAPAELRLRAEPSDKSCLADLRSGVVDAAVTSALLASDLAVLRDVRPVGGPVALEPRSVLVAGDAATARSMVDAVDNALGSLHADGTMANLAKARFGGQDLSGLVP